MKFDCSNNETYSTFSLICFQINKLLGFPKPVVSQLFLTALREDSLDGSCTDIVFATDVLVPHACRRVVNDVGDFLGIQTLSLPKRESIGATMFFKILKNFGGTFNLI